MEWNLIKNSFPFQLFFQGVFVFVTVGGEKGAGHFLLAGREEDVTRLGPESVHSVCVCVCVCEVLSLYRIADVLGGKGGGRKGRYQGKASQLENRKQAENLLRESLDTKK